MPESNISAADPYERQRVDVLDSEMAYVDTAPDTGPENVSTLAHRKTFPRAWACTWKRFTTFNYFQLLHGLDVETFWRKSTGRVRGNVSLLSATFNYFHGRRCGNVLDKINRKR